MKLGGIDLNLLVALEALLSERSVTRAAQRVGLSQPGMSNALARLRVVLGDPLLVREGAALVPTARAEALAGPVREALGLIRDALETPASFDPARDRRSFRVSCSDYSVLMLIGPLVRDLAADAPGVAVEVIPRLPDAGQALDRGEVDLVIEPSEIMGRTDLPGARLWDDRWMCCVWEDNTRVGERMGLDDYTALGHLIYSMGASGQPVALPDLHLARLGVQRRIEVSVESFLLAPFLLQGTDLVTLVPARAQAFLRRTGAIRILEPPVEFPTLVEMLWWHPRSTTDPAHTWLRERITRVAGSVAG
jgi:LysR family transcriptional regulator, nod-box dependent transcriptional activator